MNAGQGRNPYIHFTACCTQGDTAVLGLALFGDVQARHDLDPRHQHGRQRSRWAQHFTQVPIDPQAHHQALLEVSIWMSEARRRSAWPNRPLIRRMTGASSSLSSRSSIRGISLIRLSRSTWSPMPSISASVAASPTSYNWPRRSSNTAGSRYSSALGWPCTRSSSCNWALSASRRSHSCQPSAAGAMATPLCRAWR